MSFSNDNPAITNQLPQTINLPDLDDKKLFVEKLEDILKEITDTVNQKDGGLYTLNETASSQQYYMPDDPQSFRNVYRKTFNLIALSGDDIAGSDTVSFEHGFNSIEGSAQIYANCTSSDGKYFTVLWPYVWLSDTDVNFVNPTTDILIQVDVVAQILKEK
jgi:hypothetical protein